MTLKRQLIYAASCLILVFCTRGYSASDISTKTNARVWRVALATNGVAGSTIICDTGNRFDNFAAQELQRCVKELTEVDMEIVDVKERATVSGPCVYIGDTAFAQAMGENAAALEPKSYHIRVFPRSLVITANNGVDATDESAPEKDQAIVCAVYELIARLIGIQWHEPGTLESGMPPRSRLIVAWNKPIESSCDVFNEQYVSASAAEAEGEVAEDGTTVPKDAESVAAEHGGKRYANRRILPNAFNSWCVSTDTNRLNLVVNIKNGEYAMTDMADMGDPSKSVYYFVNWDLVGTPSEPTRIVSFRVEQDRLYLVHAYEVDKPGTLASFAKPGKGTAGQAADGVVAWVWVGRGDKKKDSGGRVSCADDGVAEIRETPDWFYFSPKDRLPMFSRQFPQFALPEGKIFTLSQYSVMDQAKEYLARGVSHLQGQMANDYPARRKAADIGIYPPRSAARVLSATTMAGDAGSTNVPGPGCLPVNLYMGSGLSFAKEHPTTVSELDLTIPTAINTTRANRKSPKTREKPEVWFSCGLLNQALGQPLISYPTVVRNPYGVVLVKDRIQPSPDLCEAISFFSLFEGDGCYYWDDVGLSRNNPGDIMTTYQDWADKGQVPKRAEWVPDKEGDVPSARTTFVYPERMRFDVDYVALGAWKYSEVATICAQGKKQDLPFSVDGGATWISPPANGATMSQSVKNAQPIVVGAVMDEQAAVAIYDPYQAPDELTHVTVKLNEKDYTFDIFGKRVHVYRIEL